MEILEPGLSIPDDSHVAVCTLCRCKFRFKTSEGVRKKYLDDLYIDVTCPEPSCGKLCTVLYNPEPIK